jgi:PAB-dependent poly(A)-specific ribonuclease subunit 3
MNPAAFGPVEAWSRLKHPNVVQVREAFTSQAFNDNCTHSPLLLSFHSTRPDMCLALVVVYDYHPNAETLFNLHLKPRPPTFQNGRLQQAKDGSLVSERTLWSYIIQLASAVQAIHDAGLSVRVMDPTKILVTGKNRYEIVLLFFSRVSIFFQGPNRLMLFG